MAAKKLAPDTNSIEIVDLQRLLDHPSPSSSLLLLRHGGTPSDILTHFLQFGVGHVIQHDLGGNELATAALMTSNPKSFFSKPLSAIFEPHTQEAGSEDRHLEFVFDFECGSQKVEAIAKLEEYIFGFCTRASIVNDIVLVADELFTNAIYNAPYARQNLSIARNSELARLEKGKKARLFAGRRNGFLLLGCEDPFGSLGIIHYAQKIKKCYEVGASLAMNTSRTGGAGIGSFLVFEAANSIYVAVEADLKTIVLCGFAYEKSNTKRSSLPKNIHFLNFG